MAKTNPTERAEGDTPGPRRQDAKAERTVLAFLLNEHPNQLTVAEISWALNEGSAEFEADDAVERAVRELVGVGLLHCIDAFVVPTCAALYFDRLEMD
jgi:hypothetical protein